MSEPTDRKPVIGLIGAIGAGKSLAAAALVDRGGVVVDGDRLGHDVLKRPEVLTRLVERWGRRVLRPDGTPDRRAIAGIVFADAGERRALEAVVFPEIGRLAGEQIAAAQNDPNARFVILDAAVMLEAGWAGACDRMLYIDAPRETRARRLATRSGWTADDLAAREAAQMPVAEKMARATAVVVNDGTPDELRSRLGRLLTEWGIPAGPTPGG